MSGWASSRKAPDGDSWKYYKYDYKVVETDTGANIFLSENDPQYGLSIARMFVSQNKMTKVDFSDFDFSALTDFSFAYLFVWCSQLTEVVWPAVLATKVSSLVSLYNGTKVSHVVMPKADYTELSNTSYMFYNTPNMVKLDLTNLDTSNVTNMEEMFSECGYSSNPVEIICPDGLDMSKVENVKNIFTNAVFANPLHLKNVKSSLSIPSMYGTQGVHYVIDSVI